ncbi:hypothetical protein Tco_1365476, partial [Tanacetum coccineum]
VCNEEGQSFEGKDVAASFVSHFQKFLSTNTNVTLIYDGSTLFTKRLTEEEALRMIKDVSSNEIKEAMFDIGEVKAPCPDGFSSAFFIHAWSVVRDDICNAFKEFFKTGKLLREVNATLLSLVPKIQNLVKVYDFRPIAYCNVLYKCISKVLTNRVKERLYKLVMLIKALLSLGDLYKIIS